MADIAPQGATKSGLRPGRFHRSSVRFVRAITRVEVAYGLLLLSTFVLPAWTNTLRVPALVVAIALAAGHGLFSRRRPVIPAALLVYLGAYAVAIPHGEPEAFSVVQAGQLFALPTLAVAIGWAAQATELRRRLVILSVAAVALQLPVVLAEVIDLVATTARPNWVYGADSVTGLLGPDQASILGQCAVFVAVLIAAGGCAGLLRAPTAVWGGVLVLLLTVLTSTRAAYVLVPGALAAVAAAAWLRVRQMKLPRARAQAATVLAVLSGPALFLGIWGLYPGANDPFLSWTGIRTTLEKGDLQLADVEAERAQLAAANPVTPLPGRAEQLRTAIRLSTDHGVATAILGRGIGVSELADPSDPIIRPEQKTNGVWIARTIAETGYLGAAAFLVLIGFMLVLWWRNRAVLETPSWDAAVVMALPGIALLTALSAFYNPVLVMRGYSTLFWGLLGVAIAIDASRHQSASRAAERQQH